MFVVVVCEWVVFVGVCELFGFCWLLFDGVV